MRKHMSEGIAARYICQGRCDIIGQMAKATFSLDVLFRALADPTRLRLLNLIGDREICVCYLVEILGMSQPKISRHLAYLRRAGIATARREGKWMHYRLSIPKDQTAAAMLRETIKHLGMKPEMQRDVTRLSSACCKPEKFELLQGAPVPQAIDILRSRLAKR
jgi:ArsR family transcriptional regulator, arsenate/arsenite/antimonite-responsive transcriptional repressor